MDDYNLDGVPRIDSVNSTSLSISAFGSAFRTMIEPVFLSSSYGKPLCLTASLFTSFRGNFVVPFTALFPWTISISPW